MKVMKVTSNGHPVVVNLAAIASVSAIYDYYYAEIILKMTAGDEVRFEVEGGTDFKHGDDEHMHLQYKTIAHNKIEEIRKLMTGENVDENVQI